MCRGDPDIGAEIDNHAVPLTRRVIQTAKDFVDRENVMVAVNGESEGPCRRIDADVSRILTTPQKVSDERIGWMPVNAQHISGRKVVPLLGQRRQHGPNFPIANLHRPRLAVG
jgi:hypothetical protein